MRCDTEKRTLDLEGLSLSSLAVTSHKTTGKTLNVYMPQFLQPTILYRYSKNYNQYKFLCKGL